MTTCPVVDPTKPLVPPPAPAINFVLRDGPKTVTYSIPWVTFATKSNVASGGNRYYSETRPANPNDPVAARAVLGAMAISQKHFKNYFGAGQEHARMNMDDVMRTYSGKLVARYGVVANQKMTFSTLSGTKLGDPVSPLSAETAAEFVARGGYLLWVDPQTGVFTGNQPIQSNGDLLSMGITDALVTGINHFDLFVKYNPTSNTVTLITRLVFDGRFQQGIDGFATAVQNSVNKICSTLTSDKLAAVAAYATTAAPSPHTAAAVAAYQVTANACGKLIPTCTPAAAPPVPAAPAYPAGTIAWFDKSVNQYQIAVPIGLSGLTPTYTIVGAVPALPPGVALVGFWAWESATKPFYTRTSFFIGAGATVVAGLGAAVAIRRRHH